MNLLNEVAIDQVLGYFAAGTTKRTSSIIDMANHEGVIFIAGLGTIIEDGTLDVFVEQNTLNSVSGMARISPSNLHTVSAADATLVQSAIVLDIYQPQERYLQCNITPAVQNAVILGISAIRYMGRVSPQANASLLQKTILASPDEV